MSFYDKTTTHATGKSAPNLRYPTGQGRRWTPTPYDDDYVDEGPLDQVGTISTTPEGDTTCRL